MIDKFGKYYGPIVHRVWKKRGQSFFCIALTLTLVS